MHLMMSFDLLAAFLDIRIPCAALFKGKVDLYINEKSIVQLLRDVERF